MAIYSSAIVADTIPDTDGDGVPNIIDIDDDNDGILDVDEGIVDNNQDGIPDSSSVDTDGDGVPDGLDHDSDNDGIPDLRESNRNIAIAAGMTHPNGVIINTASFGSNGLYDPLETATDSNVLRYAIVDSDNDGVPDFRDIDSDNDGISDLVEAGGIDDNNDGRIDNFSDPHGKGIHEGLRGNNLPVFDTDGDGIDDYRDSDSDNDTLPDSVELGPIPNQPTDTDGDGAADYRETDSDGDSLPDNYEAGGNPAFPVDTDFDGTPDFQDLDSDGDAVPDNLEQLADPSVLNLSREAIETGLSGSGTANPLFLLMMAVSSIGMAMRRKKATAAKRLS